MAIDGARTPSMIKNVHDIARNPQTDFPALFILSLVGNDVCTPHNGSDHMTTPTEFRANVMNILATVNNSLAPGSDVVLVGLLHGEDMWDVSF